MKFATTNAASTGQKIVQNISSTTCPLVHYPCVYVNIEHVDYLYTSISKPLNIQISG